MNASLINPQPRWLDKPGQHIVPAPGQVGPIDYYINSVAVSADGNTVVCGTFHHLYPHPGKAAALPATPVRSTGDDGTFGVYCYDGMGNRRWTHTFTASEGVYWTAVSAQGNIVAAGGQNHHSVLPPAQKEVGFLLAFAATSPTPIFQLELNERINQVSLSQDGTWMLVAATNLHLFRYELKPTGPTYVAAGVFASPHGAGMVSGVISADGQVVVASDYGKEQDGTVYPGNVYVFSPVDSLKAPARTWPVPGGQPTSFCHMIDLVPDGSVFAAGGANGEFYYFNVAELLRQPIPAYTSRFRTGVAGAVYGVAVGQSGGLFAGVVNQEDAGSVYLVKAPANGGDATLVCSYGTQHNPNSVALNTARGLMVVADGHPDKHPGDFYLFDGGPEFAAYPRLKWVYPTSNMSWPVAISASGNAVVCGSDDGCIYYFVPPPVS